MIVNHIDLGLSLMYPLHSISIEVSLTNFEIIYHKALTSFLLYIKESRFFKIIAQNSPCKVVKTDYWV